MKKFLCITILAVVCGGLAAGSIIRGFHKQVEFKEISLGRSLCLVDKVNPTGLAMIHDLKGLAEFEKLYGVKTEVPSDFFDSNILVVTIFSGTRAIGIENLTQRRSDTAPEYYLDVYDLGINVEIAEPPAGKKYVHLDAISTPIKVAQGKIFIRIPSEINRKDYRNLEPTHAGNR